MLSRLGRRLILIGMVCGAGAVVLLVAPEYVAELLGETASDNEFSPEYPFPTPLVSLSAIFTIAGLAILRLSKR